MKKFKSLFLVLGLSTLLMGCTEVEDATNKVVDQTNTQVTNSIEQKVNETVTNKVEQSKEEVTNKATGNNSTSVDYSNVSKPSYFKKNPDGEVFEAVVTKVTDGDTLRVKFDGKEESVRLLLIDTPETVKQGTEVQLYGPEASNFAKKFFPIGSTVQIDIDQTKRDKYDRLLAYVWKDGVMYQDAILDEGLAIVTYIYKPNISYLDHLRNVEAKAKAANKGVWSVKGYVKDGKYVPTSAYDKPTKNTSETTKNEQKNNQTVTNKPSSSNSIPDANGDGICNDVKGNQGSSGWIYHVPGGASYDKTNPEELFCTTQDAESAGYRASAR